MLGGIRGSGLASTEGKSSSTDFGTAMNALPSLSRERWHAEELEDLTRQHRATSQAPMVNDSLITLRTSYRNHNE